MDGIIAQITEFLTTAPGQQIAFFVLVLSVFPALLMAILIHSESIYPHKNRILLGLSALGFIQLTLFILSFIPLQSLTGLDLFPPLDRCLTILGLLVAGWMWVYPLPKRFPDLLMVVVTVLVIATGILSFLLWLTHTSPIAYNSSPSDDMLWNIISIVILCGLTLALLFRRPDYWLAGLYFLVINLAGYGYHWFWGSPQGNYAASIRAAEVLTFPLIILLTRKAITLAPDKGKAWPIISRIEEPTVETKNVALAEEVEENHSFEITRLKNQLDINNRALNEANEIIQAFKIENQELKALSSTPVIQKTISTPAYKPLSDVLNYPFKNIIANATLVKQKEVGVLGTLQKSFLDKSIQLTEGTQKMIKTLAETPDAVVNGDPFFEKTDLIASIDAALASTNAIIRSRGITLRLEAPDTSPVLSISQNVIEQILEQMIENAAAASPAEGTIDLKVAEMTDDNNTAGLMIQVTDSGGGISPKYFGTIFESNQTQPEPKYRGVGSLGSLRLVKTIVDVYGGKIGVESKAKQTVFTVFLPS